jgi:hypothetical protein
VLIEYLNGHRAESWQSLSESPVIYCNLFLFYDTSVKGRVLKIDSFVGWCGVWVRCSGVGVFAGSLLQMFLQKIEPSTGDYPLALAGIGHSTLFVIYVGATLFSTSQVQWFVLNRLFSLGRLSCLSRYRGTIL